MGKTAEMFADRVGLELEDMRQELWVKIIKARRAYSSSRSKMTERAFVYACVANLVKDLKRDAARRANGRLRVTYVEDYDIAILGSDHEGEKGSWFEWRFQCVEHDEVYGIVDDGPFTMPATVTPQEQEIVFLLVLGYAQTEIAAQLGWDYGDVVKAMRQLKQKLSDWRPSKLPVMESSGGATERIAA